MPGWTMTLTLSVRADEDGGLEDGGLVDGEDLEDPLEDGGRLMRFSCSAKAWR